MNLTVNRNLKEDHDFFDKKIEQINLLHNVKVLVFKILSTLILFFLVFNFLFGFYRMKGIAMTPSLNDGDLLFYYRFNNKYKSGDLVLVNHNGSNMVLRVIGKPGDVIDISEDGYVYVNNHVDNNNVFYETTIPDDSLISFPYKVGNDELFLAGDNRLEAVDSRTFGCVKTNEVKGVVISLLRTRRV